MNITGQLSSNTTAYASGASPGEKYKPYVDAGLMQFVASVDQLDRMADSGLLTEIKSQEQLKNMVKYGTMNELDAEAITEGSALREKKSIYLAEVSQYTTIVPGILPAGVLIGYGGFNHILGLLNPADAARQQ